MISKFFTSIRKLYIPNYMPNHQLFQDKDQLFNKNQNPRYYYMKLFKYNKNHY